MKFLLTTAFFLSILSCSAQDTARKPIQDTPGDSIYTRVEIRSSYPGGDAVWMRFLKKNLRNPGDDQGNYVAGTVVVQFVVDREGNVSNIQAISGPEKGGLREEAIRLIKISKRWSPAIQDGRQVRSYVKTPIVFKLE
jgi:protein TonB